MKFQNRFVAALPSDPSDSVQSRLVNNACYSRVSPTPVPRPQVLSYARSLADQLGVSHAWLESSEGAEVLGGNKLLEGMVPYAMCYGGHQFGNWAGQLGDGRAINLGEWIAPDGSSWTWQLKGSGKTPYSRFGDGKAVLRSSLREYLCSEAMHALGVPTTRALALVGTGESVTRDMFYDGNARKEPGAIVCRVAESFIRFGNFEILTARGEIENLRALTDFTIRNYFPELGEPDLACYERWFHEVSVRTADLMCDWMRVGFVHGVMNTDNMSILGLTIDYGPYGWIDAYDSGWTPNTTDAEFKRYAYGGQPQIGQWNLVQLANALYPLFGEVEPLQRGLDAYVDRISNGYLQMQGTKLGLQESDTAASRSCVEHLERCWPLTEIDMTIFYRSLAKLPEDWFSNRSLANEEVREIFMEIVGEAFYERQELSSQGLAPFWEWVDEYRGVVNANGLAYSERVGRMNRTNPKYVLRNYMAQQAIEEAERGELEELDRLMLLLSRPYDEQPEFEARYFRRRPDWARSRPGCSTLSCSS